MPAFSFYLKCLKHGGEVILRTNEEFYVEEARYFSKVVWSLGEIYSGNIQEPRGVTHFERKYLKRNEPCFEVIWRKN